MVAVEEEEEGYDRREKWVKQYSSNHQILLVGDGDFSFSLCLARSFASASNLVVTSLDSYDVVIKKYKEAKSNLESLLKLGASFVDGVDATMMKYHAHLEMRKFDRIIFNFPHAGFRGKEDDPIVIHQHRTLVHNFFWNARHMLQYNGEIHINHKTTVPFCDWNIEELASWNSLALIEEVEFKIEDYPGYKQKRGDGPRCDQPFPLGPCSTFKFWLSPKSNDMRRSQTGHFTMFNYITSRPLKRKTPLESTRYPQLDHISRTIPNFECVGFPLTDPAVRNWEEEFVSFPRPLDQNLTEIHKRARCDVVTPFHEMKFGFDGDLTLNHGYGTYLSPEFGRRTCRDVGFHVNEYLRGDFNKDMVNTNPKGASNHGIILPDCSGRTRYDGGYSVNEPRRGFDRHMVSMHPQINLNPELDRTKALSLVRKYGIETLREFSFS